MTINKFIYFRVYGLVYDSLDKPYLGIYPYFEYNKGIKTKVAYGIPKNSASVVFPNGLDSFYAMETDMKTIEKINRTFCNINYGKGQRTVSKRAQGSPKGSSVFLELSCTERSRR